jgi:tryptophan synthase alpha chain
MKRIEQTFTDLKKSNKNAFVAFITAGDPDYKASLEILKNLPKQGVDIIELGIPFLDPAGDGPIIEIASKRAIENGMNLKKLLVMVEEFRKTNSNTPIILMGYYNSVLYYGLEKFSKDAKKAGADGILIVDLPPEEDHEFRKFTDQNELDLIKLITPTSDHNRIKKIVENASGFVYMVSILGITGTKSADPKENKIFIEKIRKITDLPIVIGFGIKDAKGAREMAEIGADGVVIGSSLVKVIANGLEEKINNQEIIEQILAKAKEFSAAIKAS